MYPNLSNIEKKVAEYILDNYENVIFQSVYDLAYEAKVSAASISRFVKEIGYNNFKDFKIELARETSSSIANIYDEISPDDADEVIIKKVFLGNIRSIEETLKIIDTEKIIQIAKVICISKHVIFFGIGGSGNIAKEASMRFTNLDIQAESCSDPAHMLVQSSRLRKNDLAFGISHSGRTKIIVNALKIAHNNKAVVAGISNYFKSPLHNVCDYFFCTSFQENKVKVASLSSNIAQLCIIDAIYLLISRYKKIWDIEKLNRLIEELLRLK